MNEFIRFRKLIYDNDNLNVFSLLFLENYIRENKDIDSCDKLLIEKIQNIKDKKLEDAFVEDDLYNLLELLGEDKYLDRFLVDNIFKYYDNFTREDLEKNIRDIILRKDYNSDKLYHIIDICIEGQMNILEENDLISIFERYESDLDIVSILLDYIETFKKNIFGEYIYDLLKTDYPENIKIQVLNIIVDFYGVENIVSYLRSSPLVNQQNEVFYNNYIDFLKGKFIFTKEKFILLQSMFYGDFEDSGKGNNGGLAILLKNLGDEISKDTRVSFVFTITITEDLAKAFISSYGDKHIFVRLPIYLEEPRSDSFLKRELFIKRYIKNFFKKINICPDVFHIRYLDNASKAVAGLSKELNKKLVFTLTPDPHRNMFDHEGLMRKIQLEELIEKLNKIKIGDELIFKSDGILGIGSGEVKKELQKYFPQFEEENINKKLQMIGEGIQIESSFDDYEAIDLDEFMELNGINKNFFDKPILLNVGRLSIQKGQIELLKAWTTSKFSQTHNLLIIGGDLEKPSKEERMVLDFFDKHMEDKDHLKDNFCHKAAMPNEKIRLLENKITKKSFDYPHIYFCSSLKEEFGIAILEAMGQGFLVIGPKKGGVKSYIENKVNGFLVDTSNWKLMASESEEYIYGGKIAREDFQKIQSLGKSTVNKFFSIKKIGQEFLELYLSLEGVGDNEI